MLWLKNHRDLAGVFLLVCAVRFLLIGGVAGVFDSEHAVNIFIPGSDSALYARLGKNLAYNHIYSESRQPPYVPEEAVEPLYPLFLASIFSLGGGVILAAIVQAILAGFAGAMTYAIAQLYLARRYAFAPAILFAFEPVGVYVSSALFTEALFVPLFLAGMYVFLRAYHKEPDSRWMLAGSGILFGFSALTRPEMQFLVLIFAALPIIFFTRRTSWKRMGGNALLFLIGFYLVLSPWLIRNQLTHGSLQTSSIAVHKLYLFDLLYFYAHENNVSFKEAREAMRARVVAINPYGNDDPTFANAPYLRKVALDYIRERPFQFGAFYLVKTVPFFLSDGFRYVASKFDVVGVPMVNITSLALKGNFRELTAALASKAGLELLLLVAGGTFWLFINLSLLLGVRAGITSKHLALKFGVFLLFSTVLAFALMSGPVSNPRLRYKAAPLMYILATIGITQLLHPRLNRKKTFGNILEYDHPQVNGIDDEHIRTIGVEEVIRTP